MYLTKVVVNDILNNDVEFLDTINIPFANDNRFLEYTP